MTDCITLREPATEVTDRIHLVNLYAMFVTCKGYTGERSLEHIGSLSSVLTV